MICPRPFYWFSFVVGIALTGCNLQQDIDIPTPDYKTELAVECYLIPGEPYKLIVQRTQPFDAPPPIAGDSANPEFNMDILATDAVVKITGPRGTETINFFPQIEPSLSGLRGYTHTSFSIFDGKPGEVFSLEITDNAGRRVTGTTTVLDSIPIDTVEIAYNPDDTFEKAEASILTRYRDPATPGNAYRYQVGRLKGKNQLYEQLQNFEFPDDLNNGRASLVGSSYRFSQNDTMVVALYNISRAYWQFLESVDDAQQANGNPFAQPAGIKSTVQGGIGVFTSLASARRTFTLKR
jgi:Domain of unknown function (DUF4249)